LKFSGKDWDVFKEEISHAGGNTQPIKVWGVLPENTSPGKPEGGVIYGKSPAPGASDGEGAIPYSNPSPLYEIVFGHRRHWACIEPGLPQDTAFLAEFDRENSGGHD
jgi:ParB family chromosome partitioning protein